MHRLSDTRESGRWYGIGMETGGTVVHVEPRLAAAIAASRLCALEPALLERLMAGSRIRHDEAGSLVRRIGEGGSHVELVVVGLIRAEVSSPDGRSLAIRYARPGDLLGAASLFAQPYIMPGSLHALADSVLLELRPDVVRRLAHEDLAVASAMLEELSERVVEFVEEIPGSAFTTVRQRIARQLLNVATDQPRGQALVARITQQQLADSVGTVREVVVRELRGLREERVVETGSRSITILDRGRLVADIADTTAPTWNAGS
jgi:CRP/FNR family cyclic AMP-dependent transcriptional regulator